jgi:DNA-directed RNA polymerase beta' subunit
MSLTFDKKKLTPQILGEIYKKLDRVFEGQFEVTEKEGLAGESPEMILRCLDEMSLQQRSTGKGSIDEHSIYRYLTACEVHIKEVFISGIKGLRAVKTAKRLIYRPQPRDELAKLRKEEHEEIVFETTGTNLRACLSHDKIDSRRTYSNDINEIYDVLGIEAARQSFLNEFK